MPDPEKAQFSPVASRLRSATRQVLDSSPKTPTRPARQDDDLMDVDMDEEEVASPQSSSKSAYATDTPLRGEEARQAIPVNNEQEVVFCLLSFLRAVCLSVAEGRKVRWKADQIGFTLNDAKDEKIFSAKTDVNLQCGNRNRIVGETKRKPRYIDANVTVSVKAQESCQMVGWVFEEPPSEEELERMRKNKSTYQLISISQCKDEIYVNCGTYDANWFDYIRFNKSTSLSFLSIQEYGPYKLEKPKEFKELAAIVLGLSIWKSKEI